MQKFIKFLILLLFFLLPIINASIFQVFGLNIGFLRVNNNFEFSKTIFFNILSSLIIILFFLDNIKNLKSLKTPKNIFFFLFYFFLLINTYFSSSPFLSFFGSTSKGHSFLMLNNLFFLYIIFLNLGKNFIKKIFFISLFSAFFVSLIGIKEYFWASFDYGDLKNRSLQPFGHPNLLALYLLLIIPYLYTKIKENKLYIFIGFFIIFDLFLTKGALGIFIFLLYNFYFFYKKFFDKKIIFSFSFIFFIFSVGVSLFYLIYQFYPEKLTSFISRFYIWQTTLDIIFSNLKTFFIGNSFETLPYYFGNFKNINLYIFENIGFTADRAHNIFLQIFYNFGIIGLSFFIYFLKIFFKNFKKNIYFETFFIFLIFNFFNFSSIASLLFITFIIANFNLKTKKIYNINFLKYIVFILIFIFSIINIIYSTKFYISEIYNYKKNKSNYELYNKKALEVFPYNPKNYYSNGLYEKGLKIEKIKSKNYFLAKIINNGNILKNCEDLTKIYNSSEDYFLCGDYLKKFSSEKQAKKFYKLGLKKLPDLWNKNSKFYKKIFIKNFIQKERFLSKNYSNLKEILEFIK